MITLLLGGARSGKSALAERLADATAGDHDAVIYVATARLEAGDDDMAARVAAHRARRPATWTTVEAGDDLARVLTGLAGTVLLDSLGTWVAGHRDFQADPGPLAEALAGRDGDTIVVSEEVGLGVHPATDVGRHFRDALGVVNQVVAAVADEAYLVVAGRLLPLDRAPV